ncbi:MAG: molecular chaperone TorD [Colwellia sp.]
MSGSKKNISPQIENEHQARAMIYHFLSSLFAKEVSKEQIQQLTSLQGQSFLDSLANEPELQEHIESLRTKLALLNNETSILELAADFCGLFLMETRTSVSPYAGQYLNGSYLKPTKKQTPLFGDMHQQMLAFLTDDKVQLHQDFPEPADHIAVILAYISHLTKTASLDNQLMFLNKYTISWFINFNKQVTKNDQNGFYAIVANLSLAWINLDLEFLKQELQ